MIKINYDFEVKNVNYLEWLEILKSFSFVLNNKLKDNIWIYWKGTNSIQSKIIVCLKLQKQFWVMHFFFSTKPHNCPHPNSTLYTLSKERVGRLKHFSISCMLPQTRSTARCVAASVKTSTLYSKNNFLPFYILQTLQCGPSMTFWVE